MSFYEEIAKYYDTIFPIGQKQLNFIKESTGKPKKRILDVACGSGGYSVALAKMGYTVTAVDLDPEMINRTNQKANEANVVINTLQIDMLSLRQHLTGTFDTIFCIGNSIAHLDTEADILTFLETVYSLLETNGKFIMQMINYDRVLEQGINQLPTIKDETVPLTFERNYRYNTRNDKIDFQTKLTVDGKVIENTIPLIPIKTERFLSLLKTAKFKVVSQYGDFSCSTYNPSDSYHLVIKAKK